MLCIVSPTSMNLKRKKFNELKAQLGDRSSSSVDSSVDGDLLIDSLLKEEDQEHAEENKRADQSVIHKGIQLLAMREHSIKELRDKLSDKFEDQDMVYSAMDFLIEESYVCDYRFTESFIRTKKNAQQGPNKIRDQLRRKGVSAKIIEDYLDGNSAQWYEIAEHLHHKKYGDESVKDYNEWSKRARFLQSRGFSMDHIHSTVPQVDPN